MKKIKVWRIEDSDGNGPYRSKYREFSRPLMGYCEAPYMYALTEERSFNERRFKRMCNNGWRFAWVSEELATTHCNQNLDKLKELGFTLHWKLVDRYRIFPDGQVMYFE